MRLSTSALVFGLILAAAGVGLGLQGFLMDVTVASPSISPCFVGLPCDATPARLVNQHLVWRSLSLEICGGALLITGAVLAVAGIRRSA